VTKITIIKIITANAVHAALLQALCQALNTAIANQTHIATIINWRIETLNGQILKEKPDKNHFFIFFGNVTFIKNYYKINLKSSNIYHNKKIYQLKYIIVNNKIKHKIKQNMLIFQ
jgi:hypothetical protein